MDNLYYDYTFVRNTVWALKTKYPFIRVSSIGKSVNGRDIFAVEIGKSELPKTLYIAGAKGSHFVPSAILLKFLSVYCEAIIRRGELSGIDISRTLSQKGIAAIPLLNPDGREIAARGFAFAGENAGKLERLCAGEYKQFDANARGVEVCENFDTDFEQRKKAEQSKGIYGPAGSGYAGSAAFSEPEAASLRQYCTTKKFCYCVQLLSGGGEIMWRDEKTVPPSTAQMARILAASSGYALEAEIGPASDGVFRRWFSREFQRPAIDIRIKEPTPGASIGMAEIYEQLEELLAVVSVM